MFWLVLGLSVSLLMVLAWLLWERSKSQSDLRAERTEARQWQGEGLRAGIFQNQNLMDRMQAKDLPSYMAMTHSTNLSPGSDEYYAQDDQSELGRLQDLTGLGDQLSDDDEVSEFVDIAREVGINLGGKE